MLALPRCVGCRKGRGGKERKEAVPPARLPLPHCRGVGATRGTRCTRASSPWSPYRVQGRILRPF